MKKAEMTDPRKKALEDFNSVTPLGGGTVFVLTDETIKTIRAALTPVAGDVAEAVDLFSQTAVFLMPENKKYKDALNVLISAATQAEQLRASVAELEKAQEVKDDAIGKLMTPLMIISSIMRDQKSAAAVCVKSWADQGMAEANELLDTLPAPPSSAKGE